MKAYDYLRSRRIKGFASFYWTWSLCCTVLVVAVLACHFCQHRSDKRLDTRGWQMTDFLEHLQKRGVHLHVVPEAANGCLSQGVYLTRDPDATGASLPCQMKHVEFIDEWQGTVWVGPAHGWFDVEDVLVQWGKYGCRIGDFLLFGDEQLLRSIQEACR